MKLFASVFLTLTVFFACVSLTPAQEKKQKSDESKSKASSKVSIKYDKKKDLTTVRNKTFTITRLGQEKTVANNIPLHQMDMEIWYSYEGQQPTKPVEDVNLIFRSVAGNNIFMRGQEIIVALDREVQGKDRALGLGMTDYKSSPPKFNSIYEEVMTVKIPADGLKKMAEAGSVEIYVGPVAYLLTKEQHDVIREMSELLPGAASKAQSLIAK